MDVVTIGILARNEAGVIAGTMHSLLGQSVFDPATANSLGIDRIDVIVLPNGCTDDTAEVARRAVADLDLRHVRSSVRELPQGGKSRAWNTLVHESAAEDTTVFVFLDADIAIGAPTVVEMLISGLRTWPEAVVTTSEPLKRFADSGGISRWRRFSLLASAQASDPHAISGQLYCARADALRRIWLPSATPGEDGFLSAMVKTDGFSRSPVEHAVRRVEGAFHYYEPDEGVAGFVRHEARLLAGTAVNIYLFEHLWEERRLGTAHVGALIAERNSGDPQWVDAVVAQCTRGRRWRVPKKLLFTRLRPLLKGPLREALVQAPVALAATLVSLAPVLLANRILGRAGAASHW
jgi:glycosyltransferase involved in cell wall biosynthesis